MGSDLKCPKQQKGAEPHQKGIKGGAMTENDDLEGCDCLQGNEHFHFPLLVYLYFLFSSNNSYYFK